MTTPKSYVMMFSSLQKSTGMNKAHTLHVTRHTRKVREERIEMKLQVIKTEATVADLVEILTPDGSLVARNEREEGEDVTQRKEDEEGWREELESGDLVRTPRGYVGRVNWVREGLVGVTYVSGSGASWLGGMTFPRSELFLLRKDPRRYLEDKFRGLSEEELRREVRGERRRREEGAAERAAGRAEKGERKDGEEERKLKEMLKDLTEEDLRVILRKKGGENNDK